MSYTHTLGALTAFAPLPPCAPAEVIADARIACTERSSIRGLGAIASMLSLPAVIRSYVDDPAWAQFAACDVQNLPVCPKVSAMTLAYKAPATIATYVPPKVTATSISYVAPKVYAPVTTYVPPKPPTITAAPPRKATPPTITAAPPGAVPLVKMSLTKTLVKLPDGTTAVVDEAGMSGMAKAGLLALLALGGYGAWRYSQKKKG